MRDLAEDLTAWVEMVADTKMRFDTGPDLATTVLEIPPCDLLVLRFRRR